MNPPIEQPLVELIVHEGKRAARVRCRKCQTPVVIAIGELTRPQVIEAFNRLDTQPMECPGFHVELSGWRQLWEFEAVLAALFPPPPPAPTLPLWRQRLHQR